MKKIYAMMLCGLIAVAAHAQQDSVYVRMSFNENPWNLPVSEMKGWANYADENGVLKTTHTFSVDVNGEPLNVVLTPSDLDETDYYNAMVRGEDLDGVVKTVLMARTGSTFTFQAPPSMWMAKVAFETYRRWSSGSLYSGDATNNQHVWGKDSVKTRIYKNGALEEEYECWHGDSVEWGLPVCTGQTYLHYIDFWLLPRGGEAGISEVEQRAAAGRVSVVALNGMVLRRDRPRRDALNGLRPGLYIVDGRKVVVK